MSEMGWTLELTWGWSSRREGKRSHLKPALQVLGTVSRFFAPCPKMGKGGQFKH